MEVSIPIELLVQTVLTGVIGWAVKTILDTLRAYRAESKIWRNQMDKKVDDINDATQATMRTTILHYCEKYLTRGWVIQEELDSLLDMHKKYCVLNPDNGFINGYIERVRKLEIREI